MSIVWNNMMSTGVSVLDEQHKMLIEAINKLGEAMQDGAGKQEIGKILNFAGEYAQQHFREEKRYFEHYGCPVENNRAEHERFVWRFVELVNEFQQQGADLKFVKRVYKELSDWLITHILGIDTKLRAYVKK